MKRVTLEIHRNMVAQGSLTTEWMKTDEVADYLKTSQNNVRNMVYKGYLRPVRFMKRLYFRKHEVYRLIDTKGDQYGY